MIEDEKQVEEVHVSAFVKKGTSLAVIEANELRRLRAENTVLRRIITNLDKAITEMQFDGFSEMGDWETVFGLEAKIEAELRKAQLEAEERGD